MWNRGSLKSTVFSTFNSKRKIKILKELTAIVNGMCDI